jgi:hypothetical protein
MVAAQREIEMTMRREKIRELRALGRSPNNTRPRRCRYMGALWFNPP